MKEKDRHQSPSYPLRMPPELRSQLESMAKDNGRSLNAEILSILESAVNSTGRNIEDRLGRLEIMVKQIYTEILLGSQLSSDEELNALKALQEELSAKIEKEEMLIEKYTSETFGNQDTKKSA